MQSNDQISTAWTAHRPYLIDLAFRMLGDIGAAEHRCSHETLAGFRGVRLKPLR